MSAALTLSPATEVTVFPGPFPLHAGGVLHDVAAGHELAGRRGAPVVVVLGGITASSHVASHRTDPRAGWWEALVGPRRGIDTRRFRVLSFDFLGGAGASTGPAPGSDPDSFPAVTSQDQAALLIRLLDRLGVERVHAFVGASFGGMVGLAFAAAQPSRVERLVTFGAPDRSSVLATAGRALQRRVLRFGREHGCADEALALARALAMAGYRGAAELERRFATDDLAPSFPVEDYLDARGRAFVRRFDAAALAVLSRAVDLHRVDPRKVRVPTTVITASSDRLVPPSQLHAMSQRLPDLRRFVCLRSDHGHDAFLTEAARLAPLVRQALEERS